METTTPQIKLLYKKNKFQNSSLGAHLPLLGKVSFGLLSDLPRKAYHFELAKVTPLKIKMERKSGGLEDYFPFSIG